MTLYKINLTLLFSLILFVIIVKLEVNEYSVYSGWILGIIYSCLFDYYNKKNNKMKLQNEIKDTPVRDMKDGEIGVVTQWNGNNSLNGRIMQRYENILMLLQKESSESYSSIPEHDYFRVRILQKGEILIIE